ncbi:MalY/PatB family protein [Pseudoruegeria sp. HB172150]|uniref:MalY/PatB family protein n=1 Tax=Pseudoruegeria sp. HB172150 TaxID=2721164 RepID=UPI001556D2EE|nr:MalY/PatB family protein [Pseudoruegeria sp. HB172150]
MNFDEIRDRSGIDSSKWGRMEEFSGVSPTDGIAMWVADMDFGCAPAIREAVRREAEHGFFGYFGDPSSVSEAISGWMTDRHGWAVDPKWISYSTGVVAGFGQVLEAYTERGDGVVLFSPVYHAFFYKLQAMGREIVQSELVNNDGRYEMDLDALEDLVTDRVKAVVLCSPHNPGGRLWEAEEISALADFCVKHDLILISDEIHMDLVFPDSKHVPTAIAAPRAKDRLVTLTAASKGFNIAGGETGFIIAEDEEIRKRLEPVQKYMSGPPNRFGMIMVRAALTSGGDWSDAVRAYLKDNFDLWREHIEGIPGVRVMDMKSTYLTWIDFSRTGLLPGQTSDRIRKDAKIAMSPGAQFGMGGDHFHRFNIAMPRPLLIEAIERMERAFGDLQ